MPSYGTNISLALHATAPAQPSITFTTKPFLTGTDFSAIPVSISHSIAAGSSYSVEMLIWGYKANVTHTYTATAGQTTFVYETTPAKILSTAAQVVVKVNGEDPSINYDADTLGTITFDSPGLSADDVVTVTYLKSSIDESEASWEAYSATKTLAYDEDTAEDDGTISVYVKVRDDVHNTSVQASDTGTVDTSAPQVDITNIVLGDGTYSTTPQWKISEQPGRDTITITFEADEAFVEWKAMVVTNTTDTHSAGTAIPETVTGAHTHDTGTFAANTGVDCVIKGTDYATAVSSDGSYNVKIFVKDATGNWSV